jgi:hypothetical protein
MKKKTKVATKIKEKMKRRKIYNRNKRKERAIKEKEKK